MPALWVHTTIPLSLGRARLPLQDALRVNAAEFWLKLGEGGGGRGVERVGIGIMVGGSKPGLQWGWAEIIVQA